MGMRFRRAALAVAVPLFLLLAAVVLRFLGFFNAVIDTDEGLYWVQAREWLQGGWPYIAAWDMHPVGAPAMFAVAILAFGEGFEAIRLLAALCVGATAWALYGAVRAVGGSRLLGLGAGLAYAAHSVRLGGLASNTEILFAPMVAAAMALGLAGTARSLRRGEGPGWPELVAMGLLIGSAMVIKPVVAPEGCLAFALLVFPALGRRVLPWGRALAMAAAYALLCLTPTLLFALAYALHGHLEVFIEGSLLAPFRYSQGRLGALESFHRILVTVLTLTWPFTLAAMALWRWGGRRGPSGMLVRMALLWLAVSSIAVAGPGYFFPHYFVIWLPPLSLLMAMGSWAMASRLPSRWRRRGFVVIIAVLVIGSWRADATFRIDRGIGLFAPDPVRQVAAEVRSRIEPGEPIWVVNYHPAVYVLAGAAIPTRFVFPAHLTGKEFTSISGVDTDEEVARILGTWPRLIVIDRGWWPSVRETAQAMLDEVLERDYELVAEVPEERGPIEIWRPR
ncbi:glycosyltransferase family 39 protein [Siccirubricoccus sp. KC 17139]|uniref:Glycosyltransferase family 39 protein n=1 Tax=Siccirubricoccus soli TaxID=2899147 RepID=A0ABT1D877_9PROT|nr:glycosyltransferase family 39 protein [Siccirubricoccus soli]MCO6418111.1 glycosyltransferase family 39 protein [Siccirubricoccus soli]MCP2684246.1 glycosyltransferase family 39 protein [Siccirubricoccus soli]